MTSIHCHALDLPIEQAEASAEEGSDDETEDVEIPATGDSESTSEEDSEIIIPSFTGCFLVLSYCLLTRLV